ncbi:MAG: NAD(P)H-dependent oxidoreductase [Pseudomonadota bacterium]
MGKRIFILNGHPAEKSLSRSFAESYQTAAEQNGNEVRIKHLHQIQFDADYGEAGYDNAKPLEPALEAALADIEWCNHWVICTPMWWGGLPGKLKGFMDRALVPGRAFSTRETTKLGLPKPLLTGRSARVIITADTPGFFLALAYGNAIKKQLKGQILGFVGFKPVDITYFAPTTEADEKTVTDRIEEVRQLGARAA